MLSPLKDSAHPSHVIIKKTRKLYFFLHYLFHYSRNGSKWPVNSSETEDFS